MMLLPKVSHDGRVSGGDESFDVADRETLSEVIVDFAVDCHIPPHSSAAMVYPSRSRMGVAAFGGRSTPT